ncbi:MAG: hypothetical protein AB1428_13530 [Bacteroidota bacterium]
MQRRRSSQVTRALSFLLPAVVSLCCTDLGTEPDLFSGITETGPSGPQPIGKIDIDDWRQISLCDPPDSIYNFQRCVFVAAAYPNPASGGSNFQFTIPGWDSVVITLNDRPDHAIDWVARRRIPPGTHQFSVPLTGLEPKLYRLYFSVIRPPQVWTTYGDIEVMQ